MLACWLAGWFVVTIYKDGLLLLRITHTGTVRTVRYVLDYTHCESPVASRTVSYVLVDVFGVSGLARAVFRRRIRSCTVVL